MKNLALALALIFAVSLSPAQQRQRGNQNRQDRMGQAIGSMVEKATEDLAKASDPLEIIYRKDVQRDLKLDLGQRNKLDNLHAQQLRDIAAATARNRRNPKVLEEPQEKARKQTQEKIDELLTEAQKARLHQISLQLQGSSSLLMDDVQKKLGVTAAQKTQFEQIQEERDSKMVELRGQVATRQLRINELSGAIKKLNEQMNVSLEALLSDEQKATLKAMFGEKFKPDL